jgi:uncharacterized protein
MAKSLGARHIVVKTDELNDKNFIANSLNRCYFCKKSLFRKLKNLALKFNLNYVVDASNISDKKDFRPGARAKKELHIRSPLEEAGFTKVDIRRLSKRLGLASWDKPQQACLASRISYGTRVTPELLGRVNKAEIYLRSLGFTQVRLRHNNGLCRIEVLEKDIPELIDKRDLIAEKLKRLGYNYVTVDLEGYRAGSMNEVMK